MRIDGFGRVASGGGTSKSSASAGAFQLGETREQASPRAAAPLRQAYGLDTLIALQTIAPETSRERRRRAVKRGRGMLDALDGIKLALVEGRENPAALASLAARVDDRRDETDDEGLDSVLAAIELRVQVELAKRGR